MKQFNHGGSYDGKKKAYEEKLDAKLKEWKDRIVGLKAKKEAQ